jgi:NAD+ diphosphatase
VAGVIAEPPLSRTRTDRAADARVRPDLVPSLLTDPATRVLLAHGGAVVTRPGERALLTPGGRLPEGWAFLGYDDAPGGGRGTAYLARLVPDVGSAVLVPGDRWSSLREVGDELSARDAGLATAAVALEAWHLRHPRCPRCGEATVSHSAGWVRRCTADGSDHYPRTDAAVIMAVVDGRDRLLLGHSAHWPENRFSTLAGFVEPGESVENAIRREVLEEVGVTVGAVEYRGSQPWPFPASLMLGFRAQALSADITVDGEEVTEARWFARAELRAAVVSGAVLLPSSTSIARMLIEEWYGSELPNPV